MSYDARPSWDARPLWMDIKQIDVSWHSNPGHKYGKFLRLIAERILSELGDDRLPRNHTAQDVVDWLLEQAEKGDNDIRYNYHWQIRNDH